ncbi:hypothetical protein CW304_07675 [Bacillus sp. UFRGS-B20]|nr:hypothetical protein CW304_07675 [Bacillus sp. UFRGS-B20]
MIWKIERFVIPNFLSLINIWRSFHQYEELSLTFLLIQCDNIPSLQTRYNASLIIDYSNKGLIPSGISYVFLPLC